MKKTNASPALNAAKPPVKALKKTGGAMAKKAESKKAAAEKTEGQPPAGKLPAKTPAKTAQPKVAQPKVTKAKAAQSVKSQPPQTAERRKALRQAAHRLALLAVAAIQDTKGEEIQLYDLEGQSPLADYIVIASGRSQSHVRGLADKVDEKLAKEAQENPLMVEGQQEGSWVLMDYGDIIIHLFHPETRRYYDLEGLLKGHPMEKFDLPEPR